MTPRHRKRIKRRKAKRNAIIRLYKKWMGYPPDMGRAFTELEIFEILSADRMSRLCMSFLPVNERAEHEKAAIMQFRERKGLA